MTETPDRWRARAEEMASKIFNSAWEWEMSAGDIEAIVLDLCAQVEREVMEEMRELVAKWRDVDTEGHAHDPAVAFNQGVMQCAEELEAVLAQAGTIQTGEQP